MNPYLIEKIVSYLDQSSIVKYHQLYPSNRILKDAYSLLIFDRWGLGYAGFTGNHFGVMKFVQSEPQPENLRSCFIGACTNGHRGLVNLMIQLGDGKFGVAEWNWGLYRACVGGFEDLIDLMIEKGANDWNMGLWGACIRGDQRMIDRMIQLGPTNWDFGLIGACEGGWFDLANQMIQKGACSWDSGLISACEGGHLEMVNLMIQCGATQWEIGLRYACWKTWLIRTNRAKKMK